ncbi:MAG: helix-turn-helix domain-containing protein [Bacteroidia bacterium]|nr:helix-turn-helix domain-containing protein [Bacteroidia bacterium]
MIPSGSQHSDCLKQMMPIRDALDVISGKWKMMILVSIMHGNQRFGEIEKSIPHITSKVLAKELRDLEEHQLIRRAVYDDYPVRIEYTATPYAQTLEKVMMALHEWGSQHRQLIMGQADVKTV